MYRKILTLGLTILFMYTGSVSAQPWQVDVPVLGDSSIAGWSPDSNAGSQQWLFVNTFGWQNQRVLIKFDLDFLSGMEILSATLRIQTTGCAPIGTVEVHRGLYSWEEMTVTYNNYGDMTAYGVFTFLGHVDSAPDQVWQALDVTDAVQDWADGVHSNYGFYLANGEGTFRAKEGCSDGAILDVTYTTIAEVTIEGTVELQDYVDDITTVPVTFDLVDPETLYSSETKVVYLNADGSFSFTTRLLGTYNITAKAPTWLRQEQTNIDITSGATVHFSLINGDCDGNNSIGFMDFNIVVIHFGYIEGQSAWYPAADLDGDGSVGFNDLNIVAKNFGEIGSELRERIILVLADSSTVPEQTAANDLLNYLQQATGGQFQVVTESQAPTTGPRIFVGQTQFAQQNEIPGYQELGDEEWIIKSLDDQNALVITGGRPRGTLYGAYHYLERFVGVRWWNPWEESVPTIQEVTLKGIDLQDQPAFNYRDVYMTWGNDGGRYAARNRYNRQGDQAIVAAYGGEVGYGPPYFVHTFYLYIPPWQYFDTNPEYFSLINGVRTHQYGQLCMTNQELRSLMAQKLRNYITTSRQQAAQNNVPPPKVYDISPNDWTGPCQCSDCQAIVQAEGSQSGLLLDFVNYLADDIRDDYPDILIGTLAYLHTSRPPDNIRPRDNVSITLCDTASNRVKDILSSDNTSFRNRLLSWVPLTDNLRIWDYAITYGSTTGFPLPSLRTYVNNYRFFAENSVKGVFSEHEGRIRSDMRDLKFWVMAKLKENPYADYDALLEDFTEGFYGPSGVYIRQYLAELEASAEATNAYIMIMGPSPEAHSYLTLDFVQYAHGLFDTAEATVAGDPVLMRRVRHARLPLDRATAWLNSKLVHQWIELGNPQETFPFDREAIMARFRQTWYDQVDLRVPINDQTSEKAQVDDEIDRIRDMPEYIPPPSFFSHLPSWRVHDFPYYSARRYKNIAIIADDPEAESGKTVRLAFPTPVDPDQHPEDTYKLPIRWGIYDQAGVLPHDRATNIHAHQIPSAGYHWYKMGTFPISHSDYVWLFWSWIVQFDIGSAATPEIPDQLFEVWVRMKLEGPQYPHGDPSDPNAINVERLVLVDVTDIGSSQGYTLNLSKIGEGSVIVNGTLRPLPWSEMFFGGIDVTFEAVSDTNWEFTTWSGNIYTSTNPYTIRMDRNRDITANFEFMTEISGTIELQDYLGDITPWRVRIQLRNPGTTTILQTANVYPDPNGAYFFTTDLYGTYDITALVTGADATWLRRTHQNIHTGSGEPVNFSFINGDAASPPDNRVDATDLNFVQLRLGTVVGDPTFSHRADLNGDDQVDAEDLAIVNKNLGTIGDN